jgi:hypothetical protein
MQASIFALDLKFCCCFFHGYLNEVGCMVCKYQSDIYSVYHKVKLVCAFICLPLLSSDLLSMLWVLRVVVCTVSKWCYLQALKCTDG